MTHSPTCLFCGYSRSVPVAGCDHATLPTAGEEMAAAFRAMEPGASGLRDSLEWHRVNQCENAGPDEFGRNLADLGALEAEVTRLRAEAALLGAELVDLQRQVVALQAELEQERRDNGRLRALYEAAREVRDAAYENASAEVERLRAEHAYCAEASGAARDAIVASAAEATRLRAFIVEFDEAYSGRDGGHQRDLRHAAFERFRRAVRSLGEEADKARAIAAEAERGGGA